MKKEEYYNDPYLVYYYKAGQNNFNPLTKFNVNRETVRKLEKVIFKKINKNLHYDHLCYPLIEQCFEESVSQYVEIDGSQILTKNEWNYLFLLYQNYLIETGFEDQLANGKYFDIYEVLASNFYANL